MTGSVDIARLAARVAEALGRHYALTPLGVKCTFPVFKGTADGAPSIFVKIGLREEWHRTARVVNAASDPYREPSSAEQPSEARQPKAALPSLFPALLTPSPIPYGEDRVVFISEWREAKMVFPEDMTPAQQQGFVDGCVRLSDALQAVETFTPIAKSPLAPEQLFATLADYAARHPVASRLLKSILSIPEAERTFGSRPLAIIHGDFHAKNFGFAGDALSVVFDFDKLTQGLACGDLGNALMERFSCLGLSRDTRRRLRAATRAIVTAAPWSREDFVITCNHIRLAFAARRIVKHPHSAWVAFDIARRDRRLREFLGCL